MPCGLGLSIESLFYRGCSNYAPPRFGPVLSPLLQQAAGVIVSQVNVVAVQSLVQTKGLTVTALVNYC